jgi:hypothetical protein
MELYAQWDTSFLRSAAATPGAQLQGSLLEDAHAAAAAAAPEPQPDAAEGWLVHASIGPTPDVAKQEQQQQQQQVSRQPATSANTATQLQMPLHVITGENFHTVQRLGAGSFGSVYAGIWEGAEVAIKLLHKGSSSSSASGAAGTGAPDRLRHLMEKEVLLQV